MFLNFHGRRSILYQFLTLSEIISISFECFILNSYRIIKGIQILIIKFSFSILLTHCPLIKIDKNRAAVTRKIIRKMVNTCDNFKGLVKYYKKDLCTYFRSNKKMMTIQFKLKIAASY